MGVQLAVASRKNPITKSKLNSQEIERLILDHRENGRKLARSVLRKWRARLSLEEVDSIVDLTLCEAAQRYNPQKGACFMTFVFYHLRGYLVRAVASAAHANTIVHSTARHTAAGNNGVNDELCLAYIPDCASFGLQEVEGPEGLLLKKEKAEVCRDACSQLDELEQEIINRSFADEESLVDIARKLGYSRCHISRVKKRALERLGGSIVEYAETTSGSNLTATKVRKRSAQNRARRRTRKATVIRFPLARTA